MVGARSWTQVLWENKSSLLTAEPFLRHLKEKNYISFFFRLPFLSGGLSSVVQAATERALAFASSVLGFRAHTTTPSSLIFLSCESQGKGNRLIYLLTFPIKKLIHFGEFLILVLNFTIKQCLVSWEYSFVIFGSFW